MQMLCIDVSLRFEIQEFQYRDNASSIQFNQPDLCRLCRPPRQLHEEKHHHQVEEEAEIEGNVHHVASRLL